MRSVGYYEQAREIIDEFGINMLKEQLKVTPKHQCNAFLMEAAHQQDKKVVQALIPFADEDSCFKALEASIREYTATNPKILKMLIEVSDCKTGNSKILTKAARFNHTQTFQTLLPHCEVNANNANTIMKYSVKNNNKEIFAAVLPHLAAPTLTSQWVMEAIKLGQPEMVEQLLPRANLITLFKDLQQGNVYNTEVSHQSSLKNAEIYKCLAVINTTFKEKMNYDLFSDIPALDFYRDVSESPKVKR